MSAINIDNQIQTKYNFTIAGKDRGMTFSDVEALELSKVELRVTKLIDGITDKELKELDHETVDQQAAYLEKKYNELRDIIIGYFDKHFGDGNGEEIYDFYNQSTRALSTVFRKVADYLDKVDVSQAKVNRYGRRHGKKVQPTLQAGA
ncbi:hypothetical protein BSQ39_08190 [Loigolactobacillus backii]|uniref:hypothetical protein n=1 Tax=Loigolactobacillus backii TaxID=375175 RepID=UPI000C1CB61A|nr:hypothetical protein [Loigolactobacillus backii]PIO83545.1 hypothetical protein BSQ39_08190 [Loigolactobacillus backii]